MMMQTLVQFIHSSPIHNFAFVFGKNFILISVETTSYNMVRRFSLKLAFGVNILFKVFLLRHAAMNRNVLLSPLMRSSYHLC